MADAATNITAKSLAQLNTLSEDQLQDLLQKEGEKTNADFTYYGAIQEAIGYKKEQREQAASDKKSGKPVEQLKPAPHAKRGGGADEKTKALIKEAFKDPTTKEVIESRKAEAAQKKKSEPQSKVSAASVKAHYEKKLKQSEANQVFNEEKFKYDVAEQTAIRDARRNLEKDARTSTLLGIKLRRVEEYKRIEAAKDEIREDAKKKFELKQGEIRQAMLNYKSRNPYKTVFSSSWGIASALIGAMSQSLFGGENEAVKFLNNKVDAMVKQNANEYSTLSNELAAEEGMFKNILDVTQGQIDDIHQQKELFLDDISGAIKTINEKYSVKLPADSLRKAMQTVELARQNMLIDVEQAAISENVDLADAIGKHEKDMKKTSWQMYQERGKDDPARTGNVPKKLKDEAFAVNAQLFAVNKVVEVAMDVILKHMPKGERDTLWNRYVLYGLDFLPEIVAHMTDIFIKHPDGEGAAWLKARMDMLEGEQMGQAYAIAKQEQGGSRITENDFKNTYKRIASAMTSPDAFLNQVESIIDQTMGNYQELIQQANSAFAYSEDPDLLMSASQAYLYTHASNPEYLGPFLGNKLKEQLHNYLKSNNFKGENLSASELDELQKRFPQIEMLGIGAEYRSERLGPNYEAPVATEFGIGKGIQRFGRNVADYFFGEEEAAAEEATYAE